MLLFSFGVAQAECLYLSNPDECLAEAEKGNPIAQFILGFMYENGEDVPQDFTLANTWYHKAADQDDADAQNRLGEVYRDGDLGVNPDQTLSYMWFSLAQRSGYRDALGKRNMIAESMTSSQIEAAKKLLEDWVETH